MLRKLTSKMRLEEFTVANNTNNGYLHELDQPIIFVDKADLDRCSGPTLVDYLLSFVNQLAVADNRMVVVEQVARAKVDGAEEISIRSAIRVKWLLTEEEMVLWTLLSSDWEYANS